jgi:hypothetical protein
MLKNVPTVKETELSSKQFNLVQVCIANRKQHALIAKVLAKLCNKKTDVKFAKEKKHLKFIRKSR